MKMDYLLPVATLVAGWLLNELGHHRRDRARDKQIINRTIADLLEIRHIFFANNVFIKKVAEQLRMDDKTFDVFFKITNTTLSEGLHDPESLKKRYEESLILLATSNPILAFQLRSKNRINTLLQVTNAQSEKNSLVDDLTNEAWRQIRFKFAYEILQDLESLILELAHQSGFFTYLRLYKMFYKRPKRQRPGDAKETGQDVVSRDKPSA